METENEVANLRVKLEEYNQHIMNTLEEQKEAILQEVQGSSQANGDTSSNSREDIDNLLASNNEIFGELNDVHLHNEETRQFLREDLSQLRADNEQLRTVQTQQEQIIREFQQGMGSCGKVLEQYRDSLQNLEANISDLRVEVNDNRYHCTNHRGGSRQNGPTRASSPL